jgi:hypothetical protein
VTGRPPAFARPGRLFRGNLHTHSDRSDGTAPPEEVAAAYRLAGYDVLVLSDHIEAEWGWHVRESRMPTPSGGPPRRARSSSSSTRA